MKRLRYAIAAPVGLTAFGLLITGAMLLRLSDYICGEPWDAPFGRDIPEVPPHDPYA